MAYRNSASLSITRTSIARGGHAVTQSSQAMHFFFSNMTSISGRLIQSAPVGQTAVQAPQW
jgi:hypothetical protein